MTQVDKLLSIARAEIGVTEQPKGSNNVPYNTAYYGRVISDPKYAWCMVFVWWCFKEAGLSALFYDGGKTASCTTLMKWAKNSGLFVTGDYQAGDVFFYDTDANPSDAEHTGIYTGERSGTLHRVIEGNYNNAVCLVNRKPASIIGAFRAKWSDSGESKPAEPTVTVSLPELSKGDTGEAVRAMQILLIGRGYSCGRYAADGEFGDDTQLALLRYQTKHKLDADGICGVKTWTNLLKGD